MTREELIRIFKEWKRRDEERLNQADTLENIEIYDSAIKALEQQPIHYPPCEDCHKKMDAIRNAYDKLQRPCDDCISRADLIDKTIKRNSIWLKITDSRGMNLQEIIDELPSVQPTAKENLVVGDCISRKAVEVLLEKYSFQKTGWYTFAYQMGKELKNLKSVTPKPKTDVLDKIRAEIEQTVDEEKKHDEKWAIGLRYAVKIIDKYRKNGVEK